MKSLEANIIIREVTIDIPCPYRRFIISEESQIIADVTIVHTGFHNADYQSLIEAITPALTRQMLLKTKIL